MDSDFPTYGELATSADWQATAPVQLADAEPTERYTEGAVLGVGGMGKVVAARDARIGRDVAIKVLHAERELHAGERARFLREARVQGQLEHPSIVPVYDIDYRPDGTIAFSMRRVHGRTLGSIIAERTINLHELLTAFATVCLTIDYAHSRGVIHRDLKPANIMLGDFGEVYVLDWGVAHLVGEDARNETVGTLLYMAPEQHDRAAIDVTADVFALGAILFEILTLESLRDPHAPLVPPDACASRRAPGRGIPRELDAICVRACADDPTARFPSARALHEAITAYLEGDRALTQRRMLAAGHARAAREALARGAHASPAQRQHELGAAMHELARALALDPTDRDHVTMLTQLLAAPPAAVPPDVRAQVELVNQNVIRRGVRANIPAMASWFLFLPVVIAMGILRPGEIAAIFVPITVAFGALLMALRSRVIGRSWQVAVVVMSMLAVAATSRLFGPLVLTSTLAATSAISHQAHPDRFLRRLVPVLAALAIIVPLLLELAGVLPASYAFADGQFTIVPQAIAFSRGWSLTVLSVGTLLTLVIPCVIVGDVREQLSRAERERLLQAWQFQRLGEELIGARTSLAT